MSLKVRRSADLMFAPHNADSSPAAWEQVHDQTIDNLRDLLLAAPAAVPAAS